MKPTRRVLAATAFGWALFVPSLARGTELVEGQWTPLARGIAGTSTVPTGLAWDRNGSLWACGPDLVQAGTAQLPGIGRFDSATGWSLPGRDSWLFQDPIHTLNKVNVRQVALAPEGAIWAIGDSGFVSTVPMVRSFAEGRWKSESGNLGCQNQSFDCPLTRLAFDGNGDPLITGKFSVSKSDTARPGIGRRIGGTWQRIEIPSEALLESVIPLGGDSLAIGGRGVWLWDGTRWSLCGKDSARGSKVRINHLLRLADGSLLALAMRNGGTSGFYGWEMENDLARWDGEGWSEFGRSSAGPLRVTPNIIQLKLDAHGNPLVVGNFYRGETEPAAYGLARWNGQSWDTLAFSEGKFNDLRSVATDPQGRLALAGNFKGIGDVPAWNIAVGGKGGWRATDSGFAGTIQSVAVDRDGGIVVGGDFSGVQGKAIANIARWDGKSWNALGAGLDSAVFSVAAHPGGGIVASGSFRRSGIDTLRGVARFDGTRWGTLAPTSTAPVHLSFGPDGGLWAARSEGNRVQRWNDTTWASVMVYDDDVYSIAVSPDGMARMVGREYAQKYRPRIWSGSPLTRYVNITPSGFIEDWSVHDVVSLGDSVFAYAGWFCDSCPLVLEDRGTWKRLPSLRYGQAAAVTADVQGRLYAALRFTKVAGIPYQLLRQTGSQATAFKGLEGDASLVALDSANSAVVVGALSGKNGATIYLLENACSVGVGGSSFRPNPSAFQARGREWITTRAGRLDIFAPNGALVWSGRVEAGFSTRSVPSKPGIHFARLGGQTVRLMSAALF